MGDFDEVKRVLVELGAGDEAWMQVAIKPAKPLAFAVVNGRPVFGLPGNPASSMVSFELFARPALRRLAGFAGDELSRPLVDAIAEDGLARQPDGKLHLVRVVLSRRSSDGAFVVRSAGGQGSHLLTSMSRANAFALVPDGDGVQAGGTVPTMILRWS